jgi:hypothetical protein
MVILLCAATAVAVVLGLRSRGGLVEIVKDLRYDGERRMVILRLTHYTPIRFPASNRVMVRLRNQWIECEEVFHGRSEQFCGTPEVVCIVPVQAERCRFVVEAEPHSVRDRVAGLLYDCGVMKHQPDFYDWFCWRLPHRLPSRFSYLPPRAITIEVDLPRMAHNPGSTVDGGIPLQYQFRRAQPAATDSRR